jgi:photosystem II stability/assembly factor-like uncharacterized protein
MMSRRRARPERITLLCNGRKYGAGLAIVLFALSNLNAQTVRVSPRRQERGEDANLIRARLHYRTLQQKNDLGIVPKGALASALQALAIDKSRAGTLPKATVAGLVVRPRTNTEESQLATAGLEQHPWVSLGPGGVGGRTRTIIIDPLDSSRMWVGSVSGGIWFSTQGQPLRAVNDFMHNLAISTMVMNPTNHNVIYAGTGEGYPYIVFGVNGVNTDTIEDAKPGDGIFETRDAGSGESGGSWNPIPFTKHNPDFQYVNRLAISADGHVLLAATMSGLFRHDDRVPNSWPNRLPGIRMYTVAMPSGSNTAAVAAGINDAGTVRVYYSINGGVDWHEAKKTSIAKPAPWGGRVELAYAAANSKIVYASVDNNSGEIWRSDDDGKTYKQRKAEMVDSMLNTRVAANYLGAQGYYGNVIWAGDTNANFLVVGGVNLWKSSDGGDTLAPISDWRWSDSAHADQHVIVAHPRYNGRDIKIVFFGNDGGLYKADDVSTVGSDPERRTGWIALNDTYDVTQFYGGAVSASGSKVVAGAQDNGTLVLDSTANQWYFAGDSGGGDGGWCAADPKDENYLYGEYVYLRLHRRNDVTVNFHDISGCSFNEKTGACDWKAAPYSIPDAMPDADGYYRNSLFIAPFALEREDLMKQPRILAGGRSLWQTTDAESDSPSWKQIKGPIGPDSQDLISAVAVAPHHSEAIWVGHLNGKLFTTWKAGTDVAGSQAWREADLNTPNWPHRMATHITVSSADPNVVYVTFGGYEHDNVWWTENGGKNWKQMSIGTSNIPVYTLTIHPGNNKFLYVGTEIGIYASEDGGQNWSPTNEGPTNCSVESFFWHGETLYATTHGRGLWKVDLPLGR